MRRTVDNALYRIKIEATLDNVDKTFDYIILTKSIERTKKQLYNILVGKHYDNIVFKLIDNIEDDDPYYWEPRGQNYSIMYYNVSAKRKDNGIFTDSVKEYVIDNEEIV